jgi:hypothetical protein
MDLLFGDATTAMPTPQTRAETGSLLGENSPAPSMDIRRGIYGSGGIGPSSAIPGLDIDPPAVSIKNGKPQYTEDGADGEGVGGWISRMVDRSRGGSVRSGESGQNKKYTPVDQDDN